MAASLAGEARGITLHPIRLGIAIANLSRGKDALQKTLPEALDGLADAGNFGDVDARAYDHGQDALLGRLSLHLTAIGPHHGANVGR